MKIKLQKTKQLFKSGFTIFLAVIISGLMLIVVVSISNLALKETILSGAGRESQLAFYAADSGIECVLYWDYENPAGQSAFLSEFQPIQCGSATPIYQDSNGSPVNGVGFDPSGPFAGFDVGNPVSPNKPMCGANPIESNFTVYFDNQSCSALFVEKCFDSVGSLKTRIESRGRNSCNTNDQRRFERAIRVIY